MEAQPSFDISWLHHSHKDHHGAKDTTSNTEPVGDKANGHGQLHQLEKSPTNGVSETKTNGNTVAQEQSTDPKSEPKSVPQRRNSDLNGRNGKDGKHSPPELKRKGSWISSISSKFSSSNQQNSPVPSPGAKPVPNEAKVGPVPTQTSGSPVTRDGNKQSAPTPTAASPSKSSGFLSSALRRLSSSTGSSGTKVSPTGGLCPRRVMNVDPYRERCQIDDIDTSQLRRVSFCVDVEIAPPARYASEPSPPPARRPSLSQLEKVADAKKAKEKNVKTKEQAEGEALKRPQDVLATKEGQGQEEKDVDESVEPTSNPASGGNETNGEAHGTSRKKEKKKRSEEERKERKERKRQTAIANGQIPVEIMHSDDSSECSTPNGNVQSVKPQSGPTTNPVRIYRRCCQLRETQVLKRITDQLSSPSVCDPGQDAVVTCLDLTGLRMPLPDIVTLSDYLAVVPVKKIVLEDCDLSDEGLRTLLAGLLAAKTSDQAKFNKHLSRKNDETTLARTERLGVVEKLSLKNNPNLTVEGWAYICHFIHMSRSVKAIDVSMISLPREAESSKSLQAKYGSKKDPVDICNLLTKCLTGRLSGSRLEEVVLGECELTTEHVEKIVAAVAACGVTRLGLANNHMSAGALQAVASYIATGQCEGLDLGGNDLSKNLNIITNSLDNKENSLYALSLADCELTPSSLKLLLPALIRLDHFKFIDLSHNRGLFATQPNAIFLLRKYLPQMKLLKRIHLNNVDMDSEHCIALAEVLPEVPYLAHLGILDNPKLTKLASAKDETTAEEACAFYASLMAAVRVSRSIVSIDVDMPTSSSSDLVQAIGKQILAYALRNMERGPAADAVAGEIVEREESVVDVPDILWHLVGQVEGNPENHDDDEPAPNEDYIVSGTGVAKALGICLGNKSEDRRRPSRDVTPMGRGSGRNSGTTTPKIQVQHDVEQMKAKDMSKNLLESARKIRNRLQPALAREAKSGDTMSYHRLQFLESTLARMIERFEEEYPETRQRRPSDISTQSSNTESGATENSTQFNDPFNRGSITTVVDEDDADDDEQLAPPPRLSRHGSEVSLASKTLNNEEAQMHRFGQQIRRSILTPQTFDHIHQGGGEEALHLQALRTRLEAMTGEEIQNAVREKGVDEVLGEMGSNAEELKQLELQDPEGFAKFREAQMNAMQTRATS